MMGPKPSGLSQSPLPVCTAMTRAAGRPQNSADRPRTSRRNEDRSATLRSVSGMAALEGEVSVFAETAFIIVQPSHALGWFHSVALDCVVNLRFQLPRQILLIILHCRQRLHDRVALDNFFDVITRDFIRIEKDVHLIHAP